MVVRQGTRRLAVALLTLSNLLIPVAVVVFATGFFPYKPVLPGLARYGDLRESATGDEADAPTEQFDKVVFMVVDALRRYETSLLLESLKLLLKTGDLSDED